MRNTSKWLSLLLILMLLSACAIAEGECPHDFKQLILKDATCTEKGIMMEHCSLCGVRNYTAIEPTHTFGDAPDVVVAPSCEEEGGSVWYCTICNTEKDPEADGVKCETTPAAHSFGTEISYVPAQCEQAGKFVRYCTVCGMEDVLQMDETTKALKHDWQYQHIPAGCETAEKYQIACTLCGEIRWEEVPSVLAGATGHVKPEEVTVIAEADCENAALLGWDCVVCGAHVEKNEGEPAGHVIENVILEEATCQQQGTMNQVCAVCDKVIAENIILPVAAECEPYEVIIAPSTCTENGIREYRCKWCDQHLYFATIPFGHEPGDVETVKAPTCEENGMGQVHCMVCEELLKEIVLPAAGHIYDGLPVLKTSDCTNESYAVLACATCGNELICAEDEEREVPVHQRAYRYIAPDCEACGMLEVYCAVCDEILIRLEVTDDKALGHQYAETKTVIKEPDCEKTGLSAWVCMRCAAQHDEEEIAAIGHTLDMHVVKEATCLEDGVANRVCSACDAVIEENIVLPKKASCEAKQDVLIPFSCAQDGLCQYVCKWCDQTMGYAILPAGHVAGDATVVAAPTCTNEGLEQIKCSACGEILAENVLPREAHTYAEESTHEAATCAEPAKLHYDCVVCHAPEAEKIVPVGDALGHMWADELQNAPANCVTPAATVRVCKVCAATEVVAYDRNAPALGHQVEYVLIDPTCTEPMMVSGVCTVCGYEIEREPAEAIEGIATAPLGHTAAEEWTIVETPTCQTKGLRNKICLSCGEIVVTEEMPEVDCQPQLECVLQDADCAAFVNEVSLMTCQWCGEIVDVDVEQYEHAYKDETAVVLLEPACETEGIVLNTCEKCGHEARAALSALGHIASEPIVQPADCERSERVVILCTVCNEVLSVEAEMGEALGHAYDVFDPVIGKNVCIFCREVQPD